MSTASAETPRHRRGDLSPGGRRYWDNDVWQWQPLWLVPDDVVTALAERFDRHSTDARFLADGNLNQSWHVETRDGGFVLRVSRPERTVPQVAWELAFIGQLREHVAEVVAPEVGKDGETIQMWDGHILSLFPFVEGVSAADIDPKDLLPETADLLARIHRASLDHVRLGQRPGFGAFDDEWRAVWDSTHPILRRDLAGRRGSDTLLDALEREVTGLERWLGDLQDSGRTLARAGVHRDLNPRNLIFRDGRIVAVIDWDDCRVDPIAWEVARTAFEDPDFDPPAFWSAYLDAGGPLLPGDVDLLPNLARLSALLQLQYAVKEGRATPHAMEQLPEVVAELKRIDRLELALVDR